MAEIHAAQHLCNYLIRQGCVLTLRGGGEILVRRTSSADDILKGCREVDDLCHLVATKDGVAVASAVLMAEGESTCSASETVVDHSVSPLMKRWEREFDRAVEGKSIGDQIDEALYALPPHKQIEALRNALIEAEITLHRQPDPFINDREMDVIFASSPMLGTFTVLNIEP